MLLLLGISEGTAVGTALGPLLAHESIGFTDRPAGFLVNASLPSENFRTVLYHAKVVPVGLGSYAKIDEFLLDICRNAAKRMISI